jgi:hypothetical protein
MPPNRLPALLHVLMLPDFERADRIASSTEGPKTRLHSKVIEWADHEHHVASVIRITGLHAAMCDNLIARIVPDGGVDRAADQDRAEGSTPKPPRPLRCAPARPAGPGHSPGKPADAPRIERPSRAMGSCCGVG